MFQYLFPWLHSGHEACTPVKCRFFSRTIRLPQYRRTPKIKIIVQDIWKLYCELDSADESAVLIQAAADISDDVGGQFPSLLDACRNNQPLWYNFAVAVVGALPQKVILGERNEAVD